MKLQSAAMAAALSVVSAGNASVHESLLFPDAPKAITQTCGATSGSKSGGAEPKGSKSAEGPRVNPEYIKIQTFSAFRKKIIEDGWVPVPNPECHDAVKGGYYDESCGEEPESIECRLCTMVPEVFRHTSDGYNLMRYTKDGVPLGVTVFGDVKDLDAPGKYGLEVVGWEYTEGLNVILIDD